MQETQSPVEKLANIILRIEQASGNGKITVMQLNESPEFRKLLDYAYNPYKTYGIRKFDDWTNVGSMPDVTLEPLWSLLDDLAARRLTGNAAADACAQWAAAQPFGAFLLRLILEKDLNCGINVKTINTAFPGLIPEFGVMLAKAYTPKKAVFPCLAEVKYDGKRVTAFVDKDGVDKRSRNGLVQTGYAHIDKQLLIIRERCGFDFVADGELMFGMFGPRKENEAQTDYVLFDMLTPEQFNGFSPMQAKRRDDLITFLNNHDYDCPNIKLSEGWVINSYAEAEKFYARVVNSGGEGLMLKDLRARYVKDRSYAWLKMKPVKDIDLPIVDWFYGEEGTKYQDVLGGIIVEMPSGVRVRVGSGFSDAGRRDFHIVAVAGHLVGKTAEVRYTELTPDGSLRFPRFVRLRDDK